MRKYDEPQPGMQFGMWTVIEKVRSDKWRGFRYRCRCKCGRESVVQGSILWNGRSSGCLGCLKYRRNRTTQHPRLYGIWSGIRYRCEVSTFSYFDHYGGRGISVCDEWMNYETFRDWALSHGYSDDLEIDRIDNDGNYEPTNCRFTTKRENCSNRSNTIKLTAFGETKSMKEWSRDGRCLVGYMTLRWRLLESGWNIEEALVTPVNQGKCK